MTKREKEIEWDGLQPTDGEKDKKKRGNSRESYETPTREHE